MTFETRGQIRWAVIFLLLAILSWTSLAYSDGLVNDWLLYGGGLMMAAGLVKFCEYTVREMIHNYANLKDAVVRTPASECARQLRGQSDDAIALVSTITRSQIDLIPGEDGPQFYIRGTIVPLEFVSDFLDASDAVHLSPIRSYSDGSRERAYAQQFTDYCVTRGWAVPSQSNEAARWLGGWGPINVRISLGMIEQEAA